MTSTFSRLICLAFLLIPALVLASQPEISRDQTEWKTYQQRLSKFSQAIQKKQQAEIRTLQQALMVDIRREIAQSRGRNASLPSSQVSPEASLRMERMKAIYAELRTLIQSNSFTQKERSDQMIRLFKEFGQLMKAEIQR